MTTTTTRWILPILAICCILSCESVSQDEKDNVLSFLSLSLTSQNSLYKEYYQNVINDDDLIPSQCTEGPTYLTNPPGGMDLIEEQEKCSLCSMIVRNRFKWNWRWHYSALCTWCT